MVSDEQIARWIEELGSPDWNARFEAKECLMKAGSASQPRLIEALRSPNQYQAYEAALVLTQMDDESLIVPLQQAMQSPNPLVGQTAAKALEHFGGRSIEAYLEALPKCSPIVKLDIVMALERMGDLRAVEPLIEMLGCVESPSLRYTIIQALGVLGDARAVEIIQSFENDENHHVRKRVHLALIRLGRISEPESHEEANRES